VKRVGNRTARFRCVFDGRGGYGVWVSLGDVRLGWAGLGWVMLGYVRSGQYTISIVGSNFSSFGFLFFTFHMS
jgi:hypothetical protein